MLSTRTWRHEPVLGGQEGDEVVWMFAHLFSDGVSDSLVSFFVVLYVRVFASQQWRQSDWSECPGKELAGWLTFMYLAGWRLS